MLRVGRRRFIVGAVGIAGAASLAACSGGGGAGTQSPPVQPPATRTSTPRATATPSPSPTATPVPRGGVARIAVPRTLTFDTFDAARSGELSMLEIFGRTHSRLLEYRNFESFNIGGDLVAEWEQPDALTLVLQLRRDARWHDRAGLDASAVTSADVAAWVGRALSNARTIDLPAVQRAADWLSIEGVAATGPSTVTLTLGRPDPFILNTLAGAFAFVQAPAVVERLNAEDGELLLENIAGSGPFTFDAGEDDGVYLGPFRGGHRSPYLEGMVLSQPQEPVERFRAGEAHEVTTFDRRDAAALAEGGDAVQMQRLSENPVMTTMFVGAPPWNDLRLRQALIGALDSRLLVDQLFGGRAVGIEPKVLGAGQLPFPIEQAPPGALDARRADARRLWDEGGGPSLGTVTVDFPNVFDPRFSSSSVVIGMLNEALGAQFRPAVVPYTTIAEKSAQHSYGSGNPALWFGWGPALLDPQPARHLYETYSSSGPNFGDTGFADPAVDAALARAVAELDPDARGVLVAEAAELIAGQGGGGVVPWCTETLEVFRRPFLQRAAPSMWPGQHLDSLSTIDVSDPDYQ